MSALWATATVLATLVSIALVHHAVSARRTVLEQLRLDRCVGRRALALRDLANQVEGANRTLKALRATLAATGWWPPAASSLRTAIQIVFAFQEVRIVQWWVQQTQWMLHHCGNWTFALPFGHSPWTRPPPDPLGPRPLERTRNDVEFKTWTRKLASAALLEWSEQNPKKWQARWIPSVRLP